ncbi:putative L-type lectin-domain containing receptor kinase S.5 [Forsythia ovata]|uniref:L-type lectin-domain containing receptor kinase S.5 n=1 Tax=Forsythia ovata TaxID=205694 RepID=A0ABD1W6J3_9LAMI
MIMVVPGNFTAIWGFPHPTFWDITVIRRTLDYAIPYGDELWAWPENIEVPRTMFLTFSRGIQSQRRTFWALITSRYGHCVENVIMVNSATPLLSILCMLEWCCENGSNLICWGSVNAANGSLNITPDEPQVQNGTSDVGRVLYRYPLIAWPASFSTTFTIRIATNSTVSGDGMAFIIAQDDKPSPQESYGSFIGLLDPSTEGGVLRQLAVELDTYKNAREIDGNHVSIDTTSVDSPVAVKSLR